ncbi:MAG: YqgE/AlgH family protein [Actinomycetota bacterium]
MGDVNFDRAVIFVITHGDEGAIGLILNQPTKESLGSLLPHWENENFENSTVFCGGPVDTNSAMGLGRFVGETDNSSTFIFANIGVLDLGLGPKELPTSLVDLRPYIGYSGWGPMQLEAELAANAWFVVDVDPQDIFREKTEDLWSMVLRRQEGPMSWLSNYPPDPRVN